MVSRCSSMNMLMSNLQVPVSVIKYTVVVSLTLIMEPLITARRFPCHLHLVQKRMNSGLHCLVTFAVYEVDTEHNVA
jgi:hypothetical protein